MANHIENYITIENSNEEVLKEVQRVFKLEEGEWEVDTESLAKRVFGDDALKNMIEVGIVKNVVLSGYMVLSKMIPMKNK